MTETCNQTIYDSDDGYFNEYKNIMNNYLMLYKEETYKYFQQNAQHLAVISVIYVMVSFCFYYCLMQTRLIEKIGTITNCKNILFVISHPDDECMFFGPSIISLTSKSGANVYLLCLSRGNYQYLGQIRKEELYESCKRLGIPESNVQIINATLLPDNPGVIWSQEIVGNIILNFIETHSIDTVITFDRYGVSSHQNHISVFYGIAYLCLEKQLPRYCKAYVLESVSLVRKYIGYFDLPLSYILSSKLYIIPLVKRTRIRKAMEAHKSQYVWFRKLYMLFSRYVFINTLREIDVLDLELELELNGENG